MNAIIHFNSLSDISYSEESFNLSHGVGNV